MRKTLIITLLVLLNVLAQGCGVVRGVGQAVGYTCQGIGAIGKGINDDLVSASDGHSDHYYNKRHKK